MKNKIIKNHFSLYLLFAEINKINYYNLGFAKAIKSNKSTWPNFIFDIKNNLSDNDMNDLTEKIQNKILPELIIVDSDIDIKKELLVKYNYKQIVSWPGLIFNINKLNENKYNSELIVKIVETDKEIREWINIASLQLKIDFNFKEFKNLIKCKEVTAFIGLYYNKPVCTSLIYIKDNIAGSYMSSTLPAFLGKGFGSTIVLESLKFVKAQNIYEVVFTSSKQGLKPWLNIGAKQYCTLNLYWKLPN